MKARNTSHPCSTQVKWLVCNDADVDARDSMLMTPLMWAVHVDDLKSVRLLMAAGADPRVECPALADRTSKSWSAVIAGLHDDPADGTALGLAIRSKAWHLTKALDPRNPVHSEAGDPDYAATYVPYLIERKAAMRDRERARERRW